MIQQTAMSQCALRSVCPVIALLSVMIMPCEHEPESVSTATCLQRRLGLLLLLHAHRMVTQ